MIAALLITVLAEGVVVTVYSLGRNKPIHLLLVTSIFVNIVTQSFLWIVLHLFFQHYELALAAAEVLIWIMESILLYAVLTKHLRLLDAVLLSLSMNAVSLAVGWLLPV